MASKIAFALIVIGAINWLLVGIFSFDLVAWIFGKVMVLGRIVYIIIGLAGVYLAVGCPCCKSACGSCDSEKAGCGTCGDAACGGCEAPSEPEMPAEELASEEAVEPTMEMPTQEPETFEQTSSFDDPAPADDFAAEEAGDEPAEEEQTM